MRNANPYALALCALLTACSGGADQPAVETSNPEEPTRVTLTAAQAATAGIATGSLEARKVRSSVTVNGIVDVPPQNLVSVSFPLGGYLRHTKLMPGMPVRKGEVIAEMEDPSIVQLQQDYLVTAARLEYLDRELARQRTLNAEKVSADKTLEQVAAEHGSQRVTRAALAERLRMIGIAPESLRPDAISRMVRLRSPINGFVSKVNVNTGKYVQPQDVLFELIDPDDIHAALSIFEKDLGRVAIGQSVTVTFVDEPDNPYAAEVILLNHNVDDDRTATAHCHFHSRPAKLLPGMFLNARIHVRDTEVKAVPEAAVVRYAGREFVFVASAERSYDMVPVRTGTRDAGQVELLEGAEALAGRQVVTANAYSLLGALKNRAEEE
jgi:cobalt-zinc-cadmium efflux system membrane fusion protein